MIVASAGKFVFFHNPKAAGSSVHHALAQHHNDAIPASGRGADRRYLSHYGIDEFAAECPQYWNIIRDYQFFALRRDALQRFYSSFAQYSITEGEIDTRFATAKTSRDYLFEIIDQLARFGCAEALIPHHEFTLFRPQWIYSVSHDHDVAIASFAVRDIERMFEAMEARLGASISRERVNEREGYDLPAPLAAVMQRGSIVRRIAGFPGGKLAKSLLAKAFSGGRKNDKLDLSETDQRAVSQFVESFYANDLAWLASLEQAASSNHRLA